MKSGEVHNTVAPEGCQTTTPDSYQRQSLPSGARRSDSVWNDALPPLTIGWGLNYLFADLRSAAPLLASDQLTLAGVHAITMRILAAIGIGPSPFMSPSAHAYLAVGLFVTFAGGRLYPGVGLTGREELRRCTLLISAVFLLFFLAAQAAGGGMGSAILFVGEGFACLALIPLSRFVVRKICGRFIWWQQPVLVVGDRSRDKLNRLYQELLDHPQWGLAPIGVFGDDTAASPQALRGPLVPYEFHSLRAVQKAIKDRHVYRGIVAMHDPSAFSTSPQFEFAADWFPQLLLMSCVDRRGLPLGSRRSLLHTDLIQVELRNRLLANRLHGQANL